MILVAKTEEEEEEKEEEEEIDSYRCLHGRHPGKVRHITIINQILTYAQEYKSCTLKNSKNTFRKHYTDKTPTTLAKGSFLRSRLALAWYLRISASALAPGLKRLFLCVVLGPGASRCCPARPDPLGPDDGGVLLADLFLAVMNKQVIK